MNKLIIYIICLLCLSCKQDKSIAKVSNTIKTDTIFYKRKNKSSSLIVNRAFDSLLIKRLPDDNVTKPFMQFSNNLATNLDSFLNRMFVIDKSLERIKYYNGTVELYFIQGDSVNFYEKVLGDSSQWIFNHYMYHDIYNSLFSFSEVFSIKVFLKNTIKDKSNIAYNNFSSIKNITLLPLSGDYEIVLPQGVMKREWYKKNTDYWTIFSGNTLDLSKSFLEDKNNELKEKIMDSIINLIE